jgi:hypothetical protein
MIIRRATKVVAGTMMPRSATPWLPRAWPEGPAKQGSGSGGDVRPHQSIHEAPTARYGVASSSGRNCFAPTRSRPILPRPGGTGLCGRSALSGSWRRSAPERGPRGPAKRGSGSGGDASTAQSTAGAQASRYGVASSFGRHCSALRGRTIRVVAFRASHPAKPPSHQRRLVQGFPNAEI